MSTMTPRTVASATIVSRQSTEAVVSHFPYDEDSFSFDQANASYDYSSYRGEAVGRTIQTVQMRGR